MIAPSILDPLTPADLRVLVESVDERARCGRLEILFPTKDTVPYLKYFEGAKYYTLLLHTWLIKHQNNASAGWWGCYVNCYIVLTYIEMLILLLIVILC